jgi:hypothetical protein
MKVKVEVEEEEEDFCNTIDEAKSCQKREKP